LAQASSQISDQATAAGSYALSPVIKGLPQSVYFVGSSALLTVSRSLVLLFGWWGSKIAQKLVDLPLNACLSIG
jgi:hypothetical protein